MYLGRCDWICEIPFEDGCELPLPFAFENSWAKQSDLSNLVDRESHGSLLQSRVDPFNQRHPVQLRGFLKTVVSNVRAGDWSVDDCGFARRLDF
jgi:hypothetical protein